MSELLKAIKSNDLVKFKQCFAEAMQEKIKTKMDESQVDIAQSVVLEGEDKPEPKKGKEENEPDEDDNDDDEDDDSDDDDEE